MKKKIKASFGGYQLKGITKWLYIFFVISFFIILISLCLYLIIYSDKEIWGLILLCITFTFVEYKNRTLTHIFFDRCWKIIK